MTHFCKMAEAIQSVHLQFTPHEKSINVYFLWRDINTTNEVINISSSFEEEKLVVEILEDKPRFMVGAPPLEDYM